MEPEPFALDPEESRVLEEERIFLSAPINGKRKVSAAFLTPPSSHGSLSSATSGSSASVRIRPFDPSTKAPFELPESTESVAALEFLGYTRTVAGEIFERWIGRPDGTQNPDGLREYALANLLRLNFPPLKDLPAIEAMEGLGISVELQTCLTDPRFSQLFRSETLWFWLKDTMKLRYSTLDMLLERLKSHAVRTIAKRKEKKRQKIAGVFGSSASSSTQQLPTASVSLDIGSAEALPRTYVAVQVTPPVLPDHYIFYNGKAVPEMNGFLIREDGSVNMGAILTEKGGDFNQRHAASYWTKEEATAEQYRLWGATRCKWSESWIIRIQVPKTFIDSLRKQQLWYSPDWKEYVWYCRKGLCAGNPPTKFDKFWKAGQAQLIEGHICKRAPAVIPRIEKEEVQEKISESDVMVIEGRKAIQWVFMEEVVIERLATTIRGKIHIEIHPAEATPK